VVNVSDGSDVHMLLAHVFSPCCGPGRPRNEKSPLWLAPEGAL
jgi:hypothetical protein